MPAPLRIALVTSHYLPGAGGIEQVVAQVAARLAASGQQVEVLTQTQDRGLPRYDMGGGVVVRRFLARPASGPLAVAAALPAFLRAEGWRYDVVHAHNYHAFPALAAALCGPRVLVFSPHYHGTGHGPWRRALHVPYRLCGRMIFRRAAAVVCDSEAEAALVRRRFAVDAGRLHVIADGVAAQAIRAAAPFITEDTTILCVGRLERYKQVQQVIRAAAYLDGRFAVRIVGEGPERPALQALCARLDLADRVCFLGHTDDDTLARWLRTAAVCVNLSRHEAYGITILEALAGGAQVVATRIPAFAEHARRVDGTSITLVPVDAPACVVADAIRAAASRSRAAPPMDAAVLPSWDATAAQTLHLYRRLVGR